MAIKKHGMMVRFAGDELARVIREVDVHNRSALVLGDTSEPLLDLFETADSVVLEVDLPGMAPEDVEINILGQTLTIEGVKREKVVEDEKINYLCMERSFENFRRIIKLTRPINPKAARAVYARGVLTLTIPKIEDKRGVAIKVKVDRE